MEVEPEKIKAIVDWSVPANVKALRGFLGLSGYYRRFIRNYCKMAQPLTNLLRKEGFQWDDSCTLAFQKMKEALISAPILVLLDFAKTFMVESDASRVGMGAMLMQEGHAITFMSKAFSKK